MGPASEFQLNILASHTCTVVPWAAQKNRDTREFICWCSLNITEPPVIVGAFITIVFFAKGV